MLILGLDLARRTGWAFGEAGSVPESGSWELGRAGQDVRTLPPALASHLRAIVLDRRPDVIAIEAPMPPAASKNQDATISQLMLHGALHAFAGVSRIAVYSETAGTIRKHVCGRSSAGDRDATKAMALRTVKLLGLVPKDCGDTDRADAVAVWRWAEDVVARQRGAFALVPA